MKWYMYDAGSPDHCNNDVVKTTKEPVEHIVHVGIVQFLQNIFLLYIIMFSTLTHITLY